MPTTISVSPAQPDKLVVNGCDLVNRQQLSSSQNRELQRYIDANAHLLGFLDKEREEKEKEKESQHGKYNSYSLGRDASSIGTGEGSGFDKRSGMGTQSLNRIGSPYSDYGGKRKGVSWSDGIAVPRAQSHSPSKRDSADFSISSLGVGDMNGGSAAPTNENYQQALPPPARAYSPSYSTSDKRRTPYDYDPYSRNESPWGGTWSRASRDNDGDEDAYRGSGWKGFPRSDTSAYSTMERHPDDYNKFDTKRYREHQRRSQDRDDVKKFYGYGDHHVSGIELKPKRWTGGELITDPTFVKKSLKPRRFYYSPIGDGVVEADGVEMKRGPPDLTPRREVIHERIVERGSAGKAGHRLTEHLWDEGGDGGGDKGGQGDGRFPLGDLGAPRGNKRGNSPPYGSSDRGGSGPPYGSGDRGGSGPPYGAGKFPDDDDGLSNRSGRNSTLSIGTDGLPREGWTKTFITNPRELINQYGTETTINIFDLKDHTPKTITTVKETITGL